MEQRKKNIYDLLDEDDPAPQCNNYAAEIARCNVCKKDLGAIHMGFPSVPGGVNGEPIPACSVHRAPIKAREDRLRIELDDFICETRGYQVSDKIPC